jgi:hypothetical protein
MTLEMRLVIASVIPVGMLLLLWHMLIMRRSILALRERLNRQADALALLTETSETGFEAVAREMTRIRAAQQPPDALRPLGPRRVTPAVEKLRGASAAAPAAPPAPPPPAAASEGEAHLRRLFSRHTATSRGVQAV